MILAQNTTSSGANGEIPRNPYHYIPTVYVTAIFIALYGLSTLAHIGQGLAYRLWFMIPTAGLGGVLEVLGWSARLWSHSNVFLQGPFIIQITCCILGPTPLLAANFVILGEIINRLGPQYSRLRPKWYTIIFCTCDFIALVVQGTGGGLASTADTFKDAQRGGNIVLGGIVFQLAVIIMFAACETEFLLRYKYDKPFPSKASTFIQITERPPSPGVKVMLYAMGFNTLCLFIRAVYRTVELSDGWDGVVISTQLYFNVLDGGMVTLAIFTLNIFHPGRLLRPVRSTLGIGQSDLTINGSGPMAQVNKDSRMTSATTSQIA